MTSRPLSKLLRIHWRRTAILLLVFISTILIIYHNSNESDNQSKGEFFEDFGGKTSVRETLNDDPVNSDNSNDGDKDKSLDQPVEDAAPQQTLAAMEPLSVIDEQSVDSNQQKDEQKQDGQEGRDKEQTSVDQDISSSASNDITVTLAAAPAVADDQESGVIEPAESSTEEPSVSPQITAEQILKPAQEPAAVSSIPRIIHQSAPSEMLPNAYQALIESCLKQNSNWQYYLWRDKDREEFMRVRYPQHSDWFGDFSRQQQDQLFRFFALQVYGGIYLDINMECIKPFEPTLSNNSLLVAAERPELTRIVRNLDRSADISSVAGTPGHELFTKILESLASLQKEPIDVSTLLTAWFDTTSKGTKASEESCTLWDYHYFGSALDDSFPWQEECQEVLNELEQSASAYAPEHELYNKQQGCIQLRDKDWNLLDMNNDTLAVHRFPKVSLAESSENVFNVTQLFGTRVTYYG